MSVPPLDLDDERRTRIATRLRQLFLDEFEEELSEFRATRLIDFFLETLGAQVYNQAVQDARRFMLQKLDDLDGEVSQPCS